MAITNAEMAQAWGDLLGLTPEKVAELAGLLDQWALGGARLAVLSRLATDINLFNNAAVAMVHDWYGGTTNGGPNGDGLYPLMNSDAEVFPMPSPARIMADLVSFNAKGVLPSVADLPATGEPGDLWVVNGEAWVWSASDGRFNNVGPFQGDSALKVLIDGGVLPAGSTAAQFATWIADAQIDKVQPLVDAAATSATSAASDAGAAQTAATAAGDARTGAEAAQAAAAGAADATAADRLATGADRAAVADDRAAVEAAALATAGHANDAASAAGVSVAAKDIAEGAASAAGASAAATADDAQATAADRQAVAADKVAVAADRAASEAAAGVATTQASDAAGHAGAADAARIAAEAAQAAAEQARDEAEAIAGGDFVTGPTSSTDGRLAVFAGTSGKAVKEGPAFGVGAAGDVLRRSDGDGRYRAAGDVPLAEVTGLGAALSDIDGALTAQAQAIAGKQDALGFTPADAADTYTKGEVDAAFDALPDPPAVPTFATVAEVRAGKTGGKIVAPDAAAAAMALVPLTDAATVAVNLDAGPNFTLTTTAGVGVGRTIGAPTNGNVGQYYTVRFTAHAGATVAWNTAFKWPGGKVEAIANAAGAITEVAFKMVSASRFDVVGFVKDIR